MEALCRDCFAPARGGAECESCGSARILRHPELGRLAVAHVDCDAFYAAVEKRDDPSLAERPVLVGGRRRGVVMAACYVARRYGVRSAMPMFQALRACPDAAVIRPDMKKYAAVARDIRALMDAVTPAVEPISIDEAALDLAGTERLHRAAPAETLARLASRIEAEIGIGVSIGLSYNRFLAKVASGMDKPRGFFVIGKGDARGFLAAQPVTLIWGVGAALQGRLAADGIATIGDLQTVPEDELARRYGATGLRLARLSQGDDRRAVTGRAARKSLSAETTFAEDLTRLDALTRRLWPLAEKVVRRLKAEGIGARTITLKLKRADFRTRTRSATLAHATQSAEVIWRTGARLAAREVDGSPWRLIGIGTSRYVPAEEADPPDLADPRSLARRDVERAIDAIRERFGDDAIGHGRGLRQRRPAP